MCIKQGICLAQSTQPMLDKNECTLLSDVVFPGNKQPWNLMVWNSNLLLPTILWVAWAVPQLVSLWAPATWKSERLARDSLFTWVAVAAGSWMGTSGGKFSPSVSVSQAINAISFLCSYRGLLFTYLQPHRNISFLPSLLVPIRTQQPN